MHTFNDLSSAEPCRIIVHGAAGRMGTRLCARIAEDAHLRLVGACEHAQSDALGTRAQPTLENSPIVQIADDIGVFADVVIDFSTAEAVLDALACARASKAALLVGTTALSAETMRALRAEAEHRAILVAPNTAPGVVVLAGIAKMAARSLGDDFHASIVEAHHAQKRDAPSGTARKLALALREAGCDASDRILSIRAGDTIGEHTIRFDGPGETIEITHRALTRDLFAIGALRAAQWLRGRAPGWWTMEDVLGFGAE